MFFFIPFILTETPDPPTRLQMSSTDVPSTKTLRWNIPYNGRLNISEYETRLTDNVTKYNRTFLSTGPSLNITGLILNRNYSLTIRAKNRLGFGNFSDVLQMYVNVSKGEFWFFIYAMLFTNIYSR